jgi:hypothetical protein
MKKYIILISLFITGALIVPSCDIIEEPFLVPAGNTGPGPGEAVRKVLLEDYTGHKCPNCPEAAVLASNLKTVYEEKLILLTVHAGYYSTPDATGDFTDDLRTEEGTEMHDFFGFYAYPAGLVNRTEYQGAKVLFKDDWEGAIEAVVNLPAEAGIDLTSTYDSGTRTLTCKAETTFLESLSGTFNICMLIVESGIVAPQKNEQGVVLDYVHNHVLRASMNGAWGEPVGADGTAIQDEVQENEYNYVLPAEWVTENCGVIAFIYNADTKEVVQAEELDLD